MSLLLGPIYTTTAAPGAIVASNLSVEGYGSAFLTMGNDGHFYGQIDGPNVWIDPQVGMTLYQVKATHLDASGLKGTFDEWLDCANSWQWGFAQPVQKLYADHMGSIQLDIARKSDGTIVATFDVSFTAYGNE